MAAEDIHSWSVTAANNGNADGGINFAEGMARAAVNNSARSMMAAHAKDRNLQNGSIITGGSPNAQTFTSGVGYTTVPQGLRVLLAIGSGLSNTGALTLNMDGIGAVQVSDTAGALLTGGEVLATSYAEFLYKGTSWLLLQPSITAVATSGDTMTGPLTVPQLTSTGDINAVNITSSGYVFSTVGFLLDLNNVGTFISAGEVKYQFRVDGWRLAWNQGTGRLSFFNPTIELFGVDGDGNMQISGGTATKLGGGVWADSSDARIKTVAGEYSSGLAEVKQLKPVRYTFKGNDDDHQADGVEFIGLIAQEIEQTFPEMVTRKKGHIDGVKVDDLRVVDANALTFALVNCVKELLARIEELEAR